MVKIHTLKEGDLFYVPPEPHDSWVVGDEQYVSLHFLGAEKYADYNQPPPKGFKQETRSSGFFCFLIHLKQLNFSLCGRRIMVITRASQYKSQLL